MRPIAIFVVLMLAAPAASAALGDPCVDGVCSPGETCFPDDAGGYCTTRCPAEGCPDGYECRNAEGVANLCVRPGMGPPPGGALGEVCGDGTGCAEGLICVGDDDERFCSRACTVPGSCPAGFRCAGRAQPLCAPLRGLPAMGEPCAEGAACAEGFVCASHASRGLPFCTLACDGVCPAGYQCENAPDGTRRCAPTAVARPAFGERCVPDAADPALAGCAEGHECLAGGVDTYCTRACGLGNRCPAGYGCREIAPGEGSCRRGVPDDDLFRDPNVVPIPDDGFPSAPDAGPGAGGAAGDDDDGGGDGGCHVGPAGPGLAPLLLLGAGLLARRRRR